MKSRKLLAGVAAAAVIAALGFAYAQQAPQTGAPPNPYLLGTEGFYKGPRGLTSYMPIAIER